MSGSGRKRRSVWPWLAAVVVLGVGGVLAYQAATGKLALPFGPAARPAPVAEAQSELKRYAVGPLATLLTPAVLATAPDYVFRDDKGAETRFADFRGKVVVVNLWAMWCAPCRTEMPTLAGLAQAYQGRELVVLPINVDTGADARADAASFIGVHEPLPLYTDPKFTLPFLFPGKGKMPQTILLDRQGRIRAAFAGEADWTSPQARALVGALLNEAPPL